MEFSVTADDLSAGQGIVSLVLAVGIGAALAGVITSFVSGVLSVEFSISRTVIGVVLVGVGVGVGMAVSFVVQVVRGQERVRLGVYLPPRSLGDIVTVVVGLVFPVGAAVVLSYPFAALGLVYVFVVAAVIASLVLGFVFAAVLSGTSEDSEVVAEKQVEALRHGLETVDGITDLDQLDDDELRPPVMRANRGVWADTHTIERATEQGVVVDFSESSLLTPSSTSNYEEDEEFDVIARNLTKEVNENWRFLTAESDSADETVTIRTDVEARDGRLFFEDDG